MPTLPADLADQVGAALREDIGSGDVTAVLVPAAQRVRGRVITREPAVLCGVAWAEETFRQRPALDLYKRERARNSDEADVARRSA